VDDSFLRFRQARAWVERGRANLRLQADRAFLQPVLTLATGTAIAHLLVFLGRPVLTRLFDPEAFGVLTVFVALSALVATISSLRYEDALMLPRRRAAAANVLVLALGLTGGTALVLLLLLPLSDTVAEWFGGAEMQPAVQWLPVAVLLLGSALVLETWHTRAHRYRLISASRTVQSLVTVISQIGAGLLAVGAVGLVVGTAAGFAAAAAVLVAGAWHADRRMTRALGMIWMRRLARRYQRFPRYAAPASFLNALSGRAPALLLAVFFTTEVVGYFGVAFGTLALPVGLATGAIGQVFFVRAAEAHRNGTLSELTLGVYRQLVVVATFPMLVVATSGPLLFAFVFGEAWREAGVYAQWLAPWLLFASVAPPLTRLFDVLERQRADLAFSVVLFGVQGTTLVVAAVTTDALATLALVSIVGAMMRLLHVGWLLRIAGVSLTRAARAMGRVGVCAAPGIGLVVATQALTDSGAAVLAAAALGGALYLGLCGRLPGGERAGGHQAPEA
jgi:lipopolysaccharide exporter